LKKSIVDMLFQLLTLAAAVAAAPLQKRALSADDIAVLSLANYLENLERALYTGGFNNFTDAQYTAEGFPAGFRANVGVIAQHETQHAATIASILEANGAPAIPPCTYSFPYNSPTSFVDLANMITTVGIGAYLGGSELLIDNAVLEEAAASILTVEARHDAFLRGGVGASPFPTTFDTGLTAVWAFNLAQMFIVECPMQLPIIQLPKLMLTSPAPTPNLQPPVPAGTTLTFEWDPSKFFVTVDPNAPLYVAMVNQNVSAPIFEKITKTSASTGTAPVPAGASGAVFACLTTFSGGLTLNDLTKFGTLAGPVEILLS